MPNDDKFPLALPSGTVLSGQYIIEKVLGQGGFGITYKAYDHKNNNRPVAVKEYFPDTMVYREATSVVSYPGERTDYFEFGKQSFLAEAETLAKFIGNENIVRVFSYFEENGTAYFAMEYVDGIPFDKYLKNKGGRIGIDEAKSILIPIMDALGAVHSAGIVHRDVTPDNIYISNDGRVMLLDFGAARYSLGDKSRSLDVVLKHGFAPKEQYSRRGKQGPFTDIYALGATFYFALTGKRPPDSIERLEEDDLVPPHLLGAQLTAYQEEAILKALNVSPSDRYQSMAEFKSVMLNEAVSPTGGAKNVINFSKPVQQIPGPVTQQQFPNTQQSMGPAMYQTFAPGMSTYPPQADPRMNAPRQNMQPQVNLSKSNATMGQAVRPPVQQMNPGFQPDYSNRKKGNKKLIIGVVSACAVVCIVIGAAVGFSSSGKKKHSYGGANSDNTVSVTVSQKTTDNDNSTFTFSGFSSNTTSSFKADKVYSSADLEIVGNIAANIKNEGYYTAEDSVQFWVDEDGHALMSNLEGKAYLYQDEEEEFSCLSYEKGILYFLYGGQAYSFDVKNDTEAKQIISLQSYSDLQRLYVTNAFFFVYKDGKVYRINRETGKEEQTLAVSYGDDFTIYDGWLYYIGKDNKGYSAIARVDETNFDIYGDYYLYEEEGYYTSPVIYNDSLYLLHIKDTSTEIIKVESDFYNKNQLTWDISEFVNVDTKQLSVFDLNVIGDNVFFTVYSDTDDEYKLYHLIVKSDNTFTTEKSVSSTNAFSPILTLKDGDYKLNFMGYNTDKKMYVNKYIIFDHTTNKIKDT